MKEFQQKHKLRKRIYSKTGIVILLVFTVLIARGVYGIYQKERDSRSEVDRLSKQKAEIETRLASVSKSADALSTPLGVEMEIRNKFDVIKEGEEVIVVVDKEILPEPAEKKTLLKKFWGSVTGVFKGDDEESIDGDSASSTENDIEEEGKIDPKKAN